MSNLTDPNAIYEQITENNPQVTLNGQPYWIVEGDILMDAAHVRAYALTRADDERRRQQGETLTETERLLGIIGVDGRIVRWRKGKELTYCVRHATFNGNDTEYEAVVTAMQEATHDWEATCVVKFRHLVDFDKGNPADQVAPLFDVQRDNRYPNLLALAFFPDDPKEQRSVWVYDALFNSKRNPYTMVGVLRHELGHVLGFRHEHIREGAPLSCEERYQSSQHGDTTDHTTDLTPYDAASVMHYMCPGVVMKNPTWQISKQDRIGAQAVYGSPDGSVVPADHKMDFRD